MGSALYEIERQKKEAVAVWCVHLFIPEFESMDEQHFYWSTADKIELADGNIYTRVLQSPPKGRHQTDRGNDYCEFQAANPGNYLYQELLPYKDLVEICEVTVYECFQVSPDLYEAETRFIGFLKDFTNSQEDHNIQITCISDMSRSGFLTGNRILTRERCGTWFNVNGEFSPLDSPCGWQVEQGGNPLFCSKLVNGKDGCKAHNNLHRIIMVEGLNKATPSIIPPGGGGGDSGGGGFGYGGGGGGDGGRGGFGDPPPLLN